MGGGACLNHVGIGKLAGFRQRYGDGAKFSISAGDQMLGGYIIQPVDVNCEGKEEYDEEGWPRRVCKPIYNSAYGARYRMFAELLLVPVGI